jgi:hypothetical protein
MRAALDLDRRALVGAGGKKEQQRSGRTAGKIHEQAPKMLIIQ